MNFKDTYITLTTLINHKGMVDFKLITRKRTKSKKINMEQLFQPTISPSVFGTFASEYISYLIDKKQYIKNLSSSSPLYANISKNLISEIKKDNIPYLVFVAITYSVIFYRVGDFTGDLSKKLEDIENGTFKDNQFKQDFNEFKNLMPQQIQKYIKDKDNVILNPTFGSLKSGVKADGDLILNKKLIEIKCSKNPKLDIKYIRQLLGYYYLNNILDKPYNLDKTFIYWNPFYDIFHEFKIEQIDDIEKVFNKNRIEVIKLLKDW